MAINETDIVFPQNVVNVMAVACKDIDPDVGLPDDPNYVEGLRVFKRPLDIKDGTESIGVYSLGWSPDMSSKEMGYARSPVEPLIQNYTIIIQALVIESEETVGIAKHSVLSSKLRHMVYRDPALQVVLPTLTVTHGVGGPTESLKRWDITGQRFLNSELNSQFAYLSELELSIETVLD